MKIKLQAYQNSDREYLWRTYVDAMERHIEEMWGWDSAWQENDFEQSLSEYQTSILFSSDERIGYLQIKNNPDNTFISMIIIEPHHQSKGLGPRILEMVQSSRPNLPLTLRCFQVNKSACKFYIKCGFKVVETDDYFITMRREICSTRALKLTLVPPEFYAFISFFIVH